jgi:glycine betaine catabolism A
MLSLSADHVAALTLWPQDLVNKQDWTVCEHVQDGMRSRMFTTGYLAPMERPTADVGRYVSARLPPPGVTADGKRP